MDARNAGVKEEFFRHELNAAIQLPGILQAQGFGDEISTNTPWVLSLYDKLWFERADYKAYTKPGQVKVPFLCQPKRHYLGVAWYQRDIEIPKEWEGRRVVLFLERTRWETRAWLDDKLAGTNRSLCTPHEFDFGIVSPGKHRITVRVDNRMLMNYRPDAHAVSDSLGSTWNGIVGKIELRSTPPVWIDSIDLHPSTDKKSLLVSGKIGNATGMAGSGIAKLIVWSPGSASYEDAIAHEGLGISWETNGGRFVHTLPFRTEPFTWDEFEPKSYTFSIWFQSGNSIRQNVDLNFGLREIKTSGQEFVVNGRPTHLRGTHHGGDFPLTGYPPCDIDYWRKLFQTCKEWGLNHVRFHSFCPPEAAFTAADEIGIYLQPEPGMWNEISPGTPMEQMLYEETERMIKYYGNHPSFALMSASNEAKGRWKDACSKWVQHFRERDPRRLYTPDTGWSLIDEPGPVGDRADYLAVHRIGPNMMRGDRGWFGRDYARAMRGVDVPNVAHEVGQWCAYPDFDVIKKFTGFVQPDNFEIFRDSAAAHGVLEYNHEYAYASGRFQLACYKEEIEANLRTPGLGGFQLLDLHDYTGQGTALVGVLDPFWEEKGYVKAKEWRQFCSETVPLARLKKRSFTTDEFLETSIDITHYGRDRSTNTLVTWKIQSSNDRTLASDELLLPPPAYGRNPDLASIRYRLTELPAPAQYQFKLQGGDRKSGLFENSWNFWLYPAQASSEPVNDVLVTSLWNEAQRGLISGNRVLFLPARANLAWDSPPLDDIPVFWNRLMNPQWGRMLGLWCDTNHPALEGFPTESSCDWQWTQITKGTRAINIGSLPRDLKPIVAAVDDWNRNWKLAPIFECKVGRGRLLVCSFDIASKLDERIVARQLRRSLLDYVASSKFQPKVSVSPEQLEALWFDNLIMRKLGVKATSDDGDATDAIDGDPNTAWVAGGRGRGTSNKPHPHTLTISFPQPVALNGLALLNRQNDRNHAGDIREFRLEASEDGETWSNLRTGILPSTWNPQELRFAQTTTAKQVRLTALEGYGSDASAALAEFAVLYAGPPLGDTTEASLEYRRVRSTSSDVDEGTPDPKP